VKVREAIKLIEEDGWYLDRTRGSHRQYKHPSKRGLVTVPGKPNDELAPGTKKQYSQAGSTQMSRYLIIIEATGTGYSAYSPDLPGCVATGRSREEVEREMHDAIEFHVEGLRLAGEQIPEPRSQASYCEVAA
jgi:predicted RNA binding protein YcfA (HicA-like mRNA interferase family)/predicted RNase H-like HicB family nuclease